MGKGGRRPGSGRKPGGRNHKSREIADRAAAEGITPLEVMIRAMRVHYDAERWDEAAAIAKDAAPYMHPRLATVAMTGEKGGPVQIEDVSARDMLLGRIAGLAARQGTPESNGKPH